MTENKRFTYDNKQVAILKNNKFWLEGAIDTACNHSEICNELNNLVDDNEKLKQNLRMVEKRADKVYEENEHIKNTIQEAYETERTALGKSVLKQLIEATQ